MRNKIINLALENGDVKLLRPVEAGMLSLASSTLDLPQELIDFYRITNGLEAETFRVLPIEDSRDHKKTWDGIFRANKADTSKFSLDSAMLEEFLIFAQLEGGTCAMYSRKDGSIWYEDDEGFHKTKLSLIDFIDLSIKNESE